MTKESVQEKLKALKADYAAKLPGKLIELSQDWQNYAQTGDAAALQRLLHAVHGLVGSAASFGFAVLNQPLREFDALLHDCKAQNLPTTEVCTQAQTLLEQFMQAAPSELAAAAPPAIPLPSSSAPPPVSAVAGAIRRLFVVEDDPGQAALLATQLQAEGYEVLVFHSVEGLAEAVRATPPAALVMDIMLTGTGFAGPQAVFSIQRRRTKPLPVIFVSARSDMAARLAAVRAGGYAYLTKPLDIAVLLAKLKALTALPDAHVRRVLIVDDQGRFAARSADILQQAGLRVRVLHDPLQFLKTLDDFQPLLVLLSSHLNGLSGLELALVLRQQPAHTDLPVIFFAEQFDAVLQGAAARGLGEDFISETAPPELLLATVNNRIEQAERLRRVGNRDPLTGLYNRQWLAARLALEAKAATPYPLAVLHITLDDYADLDRQLGLAASDAVLVACARRLQETLAGLDVLVRFGDSSFVVLSFQRTLDDVRHLADDLKNRLKAQPVGVAEQRINLTASIGIALYDGTVGSPEEALLNAMTAGAQVAAQNGDGVRLYDSAQAVRVDHDRRRYWRELLSTALTRGDVGLSFRPIAGLHTEARHYFKAVPELHDAQGGLLAAAELGDLARQAQLNNALDRHTLARAVQLAAENHRAGKPVTLFVTIDNASLADAELPTWIEDRLKEAQLPGARLALIIPKAIASAHFKETWRCVSQLKALGCRFVLSEFENDPSAFQLLALLSIDLIELPVALVGQVVGKPELLATIQAIIGRAHREGARVMAPRVEDPKCLNLLWQQGVDYVEEAAKHHDAAALAESDEPLF